jgi:hypothetical protein
VKSTPTFEKKFAVSYTSYRSMKNCLSIASVVLIVIAFILTSCSCTPEGTTGSQDKAAIIDQLCLLEPDPSFITSTTAILESYGFTVDLWQGKEVTVDFYRELPQRGYKLIVLRVHSGLLLALEGAEVKPLETTYLFTGENYVTTKYVSEQLTDKVSNALMTDEYPLVFAVNSEFIRKNSGGNFDDTVIIMMGCESYYYDDMALAFVEKGASVYMGWSTVVSLEYVDNATLNLLKNLCSENMTVTQGIAKTMAEWGHDPYFNAYLKYYPAESGSQTIKELTE